MGAPPRHESSTKSLRQRLAGGLGFEPRPAESESAVLPLDDPPSTAAQKPGAIGQNWYHNGAALGRLAIAPANRSRRRVKGQSPLPSVLPKGAVTEISFGVGPVSLTIAVAPV